MAKQPLNQMLEDVFENVTTIYEFFKSVTTKTELSLATAKRNRANSLMVEFKKIKSEILTFNSKNPTSQIPYNSISNNLNDLIDLIESEFLKLSERSNKTDNASKQATSSFQPKIHIAQFNGDINLWNNFITLFNSVIHENKSLSNVEKFYFLRSYLSGDALKIIEIFEINHDSYILAYNALVNRYANPRLLANKYINSLFKFSSIKSTSHANLQTFLNVHSEGISAYRKLQIPSHFDYFLFQLCYEHLDSRSQREFDRLHPVSSFPRYEQLMSFVTEQLRNMEMHSEGTIAPTISMKRREKPFQAFASVQQTSNNCIACSDQHPIFMCSKFKEMPINEKYSILKRHRKCFNCFGTHNRTECKSPKRCKTCNSNHNTLLHYVKNLADSSPRPSGSNSGHEVNFSQVEAGGKEPTHIDSLTAVRVGGTKPTYYPTDNVNCHASTVNHALLATALIYVINPINNKASCLRALLDPGSNASYLTSKAAERCGLHIHPTNCQISGISSTKSQALGAVSCTIRNKKSSFQKHCTAIVINKITDNLPLFQVDQAVVSRFSGHSLADPKFFKPAEIDFLLGADLYPFILLNRAMIPGSPCGIFTKFGLAIMGPTNMPTQLHHSFTTTLESIEHTLTRFWQDENIVCAAPEDPNDIFCENLFRTTTTRDVSGRYIVALPFSGDPSLLCSNRSSSEQRLKMIEKRFKNNNSLSLQYKDFIMEYRALNHMSLAVQPSQYVIPHFAVCKESTTTKLRVVFDASNKTSDGCSLNDILHIGPKLHNDIFIILSGFRIPRVTLCADLAKFYRNILVREEDRKFQHIFWRDSPDNHVEEYELHTVTYGLAPSSFLAQRVIQQLITDQGEPYKLACATLKSQLYIDDITSGGATVEEAVQLYHELNGLLCLGGFHPRKWTSSSPAVLQHIPVSQRETPLCVNDNQETFKVLGLQYDATADAFLYSIAPFQNLCTKRNILSYIASMFDCLGLLTPFIFSCKCFMQSLWQRGVSWDNPLPTDLSSEWTNLVKNVHLLAELRIPRYVPVAEATDLQLIGFCDASLRGYACALYLRCCINDEVVMRLVAAKSRVAPIKPLSIPRLELNAALLLVRLYKSYDKFLKNLPQHSIYFFSDSAIVLGWLCTQPHKLKTYVANRVMEITETIPPSAWKHVPSEQNPSDIASRGSNVSNLINNSLWFTGPDAMHRHIFNVSELSYLNEEVELPELRASQLTSLVAVDTSWDYTIKFSSMLRAQRVMAYILRFIHNLKNKHSPFSGFLKVDELQLALECMVKLSQSQNFQSEILLIRKKKLVPNLKGLTPFLDNKDIVRVGGRLLHSPLSYNSKHPMLLSGRSHLAKLVCEHFHFNNGHAGPQLMRFNIQQCFWITGIGSLIKTVTHKCVICRRFKAPTVQPPMANLPPSRFSEIRAFLRTGCDIAGPFLVRETPRRKCVVFKAYVCLFICMATKAIHIEIVTDLSTSCFLAALDRFVARRGLCSHIHSDNGKNFVGAKSELNKITNFLITEETCIANHLSTNSINWSFIPPASPHFGGIWEANIKQFKRIFQKLALNNSYTLEEFNTLSCRVEAILNSRPLCTVAKSPNDDLCYLSPGHFLTGAPLIAVPEVPLINVKHLSRWQLLTQNAQYFWSRWRHSYLQNFLQQNKWHGAGDAVINIGDVVFIKGMNTPPLSWPMARVVEVYPDHQGVVRVVKLKLQSTYLVRSVHNLVKLSS